MSTASELSFPIGQRPEPGQVLEVAPGVNWLRMPLPFALNHINLWLLDDGDGWTIVDTGLASDETRQLWEQIFDDCLDGRPVTRVIVTHMHPDHVGLAGWLTERWNVDLWMSRSEYMMCRMLVADTGQPAPAEGIDFYRAAGFDTPSIEHYQEVFGQFGSMVEALPQSFHRLHDGDRLTISGHEWHILVGSGHSPEHAFLLCPELEVLISGDQILPRISSNVSVWPTEPSANPLQDWIDSCHDLIHQVPADVLVLPAHGDPFRRANTRLAQLIRHHEESLEALQTVCATPQRAVDVFPTLFKGRINRKNLSSEPAR